MDELVLGKYSKTMVIAAHHLVNTKILIVKVKTIWTWKVIQIGRNIDILNI